MQKLVFILLILIISSFLLFGCDESNNSITNSPQNTNSQTNSTLNAKDGNIDSAKIGEIYDLNNYNWNCKIQLTEIRMESPINDVINPLPDSIYMYEKTKKYPLANFEITCSKRTDKSTTSEYNPLLFTTIYLEDGNEKIYARESTYFGDEYYKNNSIRKFNSSTGLSLKADTLESGWAVFQNPTNNNYKLYFGLAGNYIIYDLKK